MIPLSRTSSVRNALLLLLAACSLSACDAFMSTEARLQRAEAAMQQGDLGSAAIDARNAIDDEPSNAAARLLLARIALKQADPQTADQQLRRAMANGAPVDQSAPLLAEIRFELGQFAELLAQLDAGMPGYGEPARTIMKGRVLNALGRAGEALGVLEPVVAAEPTSIEAQVTLAESLARLGRFDKALQRLGAVVQGAPGNLPARTLLARVFIERGQYAQAEGTLSEVVDAMPRDARLRDRAVVVLLLAETQLAQGKVDAAEGTYAKVTGVAANTLESALLRARIDLAKGRYKEAIAQLQRLVNAAPKLAPARMLLGGAHLAQGHRLQAESQLAEVVRMAPDNIEARKLLARARLLLDKPDAALEVLTPALEGDASDTQLLGLLGEAQLGSGAVEQALETLQRNVAARPGDIPARLDLAAAYLKAKRYSQAIELLNSSPAGDASRRREALLIAALAAERGPLVARTELERLVAKEPGDAQLLYLAASYFQSQRELERARDYLRRILANDPQSARALMGLAGLEFSAGNVAAAEAAARRALEADRKSPAVRLALARLLLARGAMQPARAMIDEAATLAPGRADVIGAGGLLMLEAQHFDEALARFRRALDIDNEQPALWLSAARAQVALDAPAAARESVSRALALKPGWVPAESLLVLLDLRTQGADAALSRARQLQQRKPEEPAGHVLEGDVQMSARRYSDAAQAYERAERLRPDATVAVKSYFALRAAAQARPEAPLTRWLALRPEDGRVRAVLAQSYLSANQFARAASEFEIIDRQTPNNAAVLNNLAWSYSRQDDPRALDVARRAYELASSNPSIADTYGWILVSRKRVDQALPILEKASRSAANALDIQYHYGAALAAAGRRQDALAVLRRVVTANTHFEERSEAEQLLAKLEG